MVGKLPYAKARYYDSAWSIYRQFSCDYYLMDLDGNWTDVNSNGFYDVGASDNHIEHNNGTADALPEIWVARISPYTISMAGFNPTTALTNFFNRTHILRTGGTYRPNKALLYIDDDWALCSASENGHLEVVKLLIEKGADVHADDDLALCRASNYGHLEVVKFLIKKGANVHADDDGALRWAFENGHLEVVEFLKKH